jgi:hypothetical protein
VPIVGTQKGLEDQAREQLMLRELLGSEPVAVRGQRPFATSQAVTNTTFRGDLLVLLMPRNARNLPPKFGVFY